MNVWKNIRITEETHNMLQKYSKEWQLPKSRTVHKLFLEYEHQKTSRLLNDMARISDDPEFLSMISTLRKNNIDDEQFCQVLIDASKLYANKRRGY